MYQLCIITILTAFIFDSTSQNIQFPASFTVVRNINNRLNVSLFLNQTGYQPLSNNNQSIGYNIVSLDGFTTKTTLNTATSGSSPLAIWTQAFSSITGQKLSDIGNTDSMVQSHILKKYHQAKIQLLLNAFASECPVSELQSDPQSISQNLINVIRTHQFDGVSIQFQDYHSIGSGNGSSWLQILIRNLRINLPKKTIVLIVPATFSLKMDIFKNGNANLYVDLFVLKYYDFNKADYNSYGQLFQSAAYYNGTSLFQILKNPLIYIDICRTLVAKPASSTQSRTRSFYIDPSSLASIFQQAYSELGWFAGYANLDFQSDKSSTFQQKVLKNMRKFCTNGHCYCSKQNY